MRRYEQLAKRMTSKDGTTYLGGLPFADFQYDGPEEVHKVRSTEVGRLDIIAYIYFGDCSYSYFIKLYNGIKDSLTEVTLNRLIYIPIGIKKQTPKIFPHTYLNRD